MVDRAPGPAAPDLAQYHWGERASFSPQEWAANLAVLHNDELVGVQSLSTTDFLLTRTGETGSWLGQRFQGSGIGTAMRQVICAFAFDHLGAEEVTSGAYADNPASRAVSRKVGYVDNGSERRQRLGRAAVLHRLVLTPARLVRYEHELTTEGLLAFRASIGLDNQP